MTETCKKYGLDPAKLPRHAAIIMDGNGRWASSRLLPRLAGHRKGVDRVREITELAGNLGLEVLSLFAFSEENWRRPEDEVRGLMGLLRWYLRAERERIISNNVRFRLIGDRETLSNDIRALVESLEADTASNTGMVLCVALSYGSRGEMTRAVRRLAARVERGELRSDDIDAGVLDDALDTGGLPPVDALIRTSGEQRLSNFLLWQCAFAEIFFEDALWPDFQTSHFVRIMREFAQRERRFGQTPEQLRRPQETPAQVRA